MDPFQKPISLLSLVLPGSASMCHASFELFATFVVATVKVTISVALFLALSAIVVLSAVTAYDG